MPREPPPAAPAAEARLVPPDKWAAKAVPVDMPRRRPASAMAAAAATVAPAASAPRVVLAVPAAPAPAPPVAATEPRAGTGS